MACASAPARAREGTRRREVSCRTRPRSWPRNLPRSWRRGAPALQLARRIISHCRQRRRTRRSGSRGVARRRQGPTPPPRRGGTTSRGGLPSEPNRLRLNALQLAAEFLRSLSSMQHTSGSAPPQPCCAPHTQPCKLAHPAAHPPAPPSTTSPRRRNPLAGWHSPANSSSLRQRRL
jgi:hypothetical protein